jgi:N-acetylmuramoyl-L-alanine amidase
VIVIDPGHGGSKPAGSDADRNKSSPNNAVSPSGKLLEKDLTLELSLQIKTAIEASPEAKSGQIRVVLTREKDENLDFTERVRRAAAANAACYVGIHFNASQNHQIMGPRALIAQKTTNPRADSDRDFALRLAKTVESTTRSFLPEISKAEVMDDRELHGGRGSYLFHQLRSRVETSSIPACHLEVEFMDHSLVEKLLMGEKKSKVFQAWATAISGDLIAQMLSGASGK